MEKGSQQELEQRLALSRPEDTLRGIFETTRVAEVKASGRQVGLNETEIEVSW